MKTKTPSQRHLLLVDDQPEQLRLMESFLAKTDLLIHSFANAMDAFEQALLLSPHFVVSDINMPGMDGLEFCRKLRGVEFERVPHVTLVSGDTSPKRLSECLGAGADLFLPKPFAPADLISCLDSGTRLHEIYDRLTDAAHTDPLTGLPTRAQFEREAAREYQRAARHGLELACAVLDADFFKQINDTHGHAAGDAVLRQIATVIKQALRQCDVCCRFGGEEFCMLLTETDTEGAHRWAERVREAIEATSIDFKGNEIRFTASIGVAELLDSISTHRELIQQAGEALLMAKQTGRNRVVQYHDVIAMEADQLSSQSAHDDPFWDLKAGDVMSSVMAMLSPKETLQDAAELFLRFRINAAPVVEENGNLIGIVSEKDVMSRMTRSGGWKMLVAEAMSRNVISYPENARIRTVHAFLCRAGIRRVVVLRAGQPVGIIGRGTILRAYRNWNKIEGGNAASYEPLEALCSVVDSIATQADRIRSRLANQEPKATAALINGTSRIQELSKDLLSAIKADQAPSNAVVAD